MLDVNLCRAFRIILRLLFIGVLGWFVVGCSAQPSEDAEDILDGLLPTPTPTPPVLGSDLSQTWTSQADFGSFSSSNAFVDASGEISIGLNAIGESGRVDITDTLESGSSVVVNFRNTYADPVIVAFIATFADTEPLEVRARNVTTTSAELFMQESSGGAHGTETVTYLVMEKGRHVFANGTVIEAGLHTTGSYHDGTGGSFGGDAVSFSVPFGAKPALLHMLNTNNNNEFMGSIGYNQGTTGFTLQQEAAETDHVGVSEDIAWIAMSVGNDSMPQATYEVGFATDGNNDGPDDGNPQTFSFTSFATAPDMIVKQTSANGNNGGWARGEGTWTSTNFAAYIEEDQENDPERAHTDEEFSWLAFSENSNVGVYFSSSDITSPILDISSVLDVDSTSVSWTETTPAGTGISVESNVSLDGGATWLGWQPLTQGGQISGLASGADVSQGRVQIRATLTTTDEQSRPAIQDITVDLTAQP